MELGRLYQEVAELVHQQEPAVEQINQDSENVAGNVAQANTQITHAIDSARRARKWKWYALLVVSKYHFFSTIYMGWWLTVQFSSSPSWSVWPSVSPRPTRVPNRPKGPDLLGIHFHSNLFPIPSTLNPMDAFTLRCSDPFALLISLCTSTVAIPRACRFLCLRLEKAGPALSPMRLSFLFCSYFLLFSSYLFLMIRLVLYSSCIFGYRPVT